MRFKYLWKISSKKNNNLESLRWEKNFSATFYATTSNAKRVVYFMIYRICHCVTTRCGKRVVINTTHRQKNARTPVHHQAEIADASSVLKYVFKRCDPFLRPKSVCRNVLRVRTRVCTSADVWTKNGLVRSTAERKSKRESHRKRFDETKSLKRSNYKFVSQQSGSCANGRGHISFWITIIKMVPVTYILLIDSHLLLFIHVCKICFLFIFFLIFNHILFNFKCMCKLLVIKYRFLKLL